MNITVFGMGKLGLPLACVLASKGHRVVGYDPNSEIIDRLNSGDSPYYEPTLQHLLSTYAHKLSFTQSSATAVTLSDVAFVVVPTPSTADGSFSTQYVRQAAETIGAHLHDKHSYYLAVLVSTVLPGDTICDFQTPIETQSNKLCGDALLGVCYNPEFIALGSVVENLYNPDFILIGQSDPYAGGILRDIYSTINNRPVVCTNYVNAEIAKLALNCCVTTKISFVNSLSEICERLPNADVNVISRALGLDSRIGPKCLLPGTAFGGPCFPRDGRAFRFLAASLGADTRLSAAVDQVNEYQNARIYDMIISHNPQPYQVAILGLSYKPNTSVTEESTGAYLLQKLQSARIPVMAYDPLTTDPAITLPHCLQEAEIIVVTLPLPEFRCLPSNLSASLVIDPWGIVDPTTLPRNSKHIRFGIHPGFPEGPCEN